MHIAFLVPGWPANEFTNGIVTYTHYMRAELIRQGHEVSVLANKIGSSNRDAGIYPVSRTIGSKLRAYFNRFVLRRPTNLVWGHTIARAALKIHRSRPIDVLEMEESFGWCGDVQRLVPFPVVVKLHGPAFLVNAGQHPTRSITIKVEAEGSALRRVAAIVSPSSTTLDRTIERYRLAAAITRAIPNPIALEPGCNKWDVAHCSRNSILFVGRFDELKGGDTVLHVFRKLLDVDREAKLVFVGPDLGIVRPDGRRVGFNELRDSLFSEAERASIDFRGKLPRSEIGGLRSKAGVTLVVSQWENQPNTALEAMIQGCPIVGYDTGGMREVIEDGVTGLLARAGDIDDVCAKVLELVRNPETAARLGRSAAEAVASRHAVTALAGQALEVYQQAVGSMKAARE